MSHWYPTVWYGLLFILGFVPMMLFVLRAGAWTYADRFAGASVIIAPTLMWFGFGWKEALALFGGMAIGYVAVHAGIGFFPREESHSAPAEPTTVQQPIAPLSPARLWEKRDGFELEDHVDPLHVVDDDELPFIDRVRDQDEPVPLRFSPYRRMSG